MYYVRQEARQVALRFAARQSGLALGRAMKLEGHGSLVERSRSRGQLNHRCRLNRQIRRPERDHPDAQPADRLVRLVRRDNGSAAR